ncbi:MAG: class I SAM-dependent methyltransferase [Chloroflexota bacterium]|nr:class I SAM-dependent methyltransferase [Chloroflexota bacterium]
MDTEWVRIEKQNVVKQYGPWRTHNFRLADGVYTISKSEFVDEVKLRRVLQIVADLSPKPLDELRVLDLACAEGAYAVEFAEHGAQVVGIEGRTASIERARFAANALALDGITLIEDDVRNLKRAGYGQFDVVLCLGILFHIDTPDLFAFMQRVADVCTGLTVIDTHISLAGAATARYKGTTYYGERYIEHEADSTAEERLEKPWASLVDAESFWLTRPSLLNLLANVGFTSVYECHNPSEIYRPANRVTLVAIKGEGQRVRTAPKVNTVPRDPWPETPVSPTDTPPVDPALSVIAHDAAMLSRRVARYVKRAVNDLLKE